MADDSEKTPIVEPVEAWEGALRIGDILFVRSKGLIAKVILAAEGSTDASAPTHTAIIIGEHPVLVLDPVSPRFRVVPLRESLKGIEWAKAFHPIDPDPVRMEETIRLACMADGAPYGYWSLFKLGCRYVFRKKPARPSFRLVFGLLMPFLFPILSAVRLREIAGGTWFLALAEGFFLVFLGFRFVDGLHYHTAFINWPLKYFWIGWVLYLELLAWDYADPSALRQHGKNATPTATSAGASSEVGQGSHKSE